MSCSTGYEISQDALTRSTVVMRTVVTMTSKVNGKTGILIPVDLKPAKNKLLQKWTFWLGREVQGGVLFLRHERIEAVRVQSELKVSEQV